MTAYIDRRLTETISAARESDLVEAIIVVKEIAGSSTAAEDCRLTQQVVGSAVERTGDLPHAVRYFPRANAVVLSASSRLIQELLKDERLAVASATDMEIMVFPKEIRSAEKGKEATT